MLNLKIENEMVFVLFYKQRKPTGILIISKLGLRGGYQKKCILTVW